LYIANTTTSMSKNHCLLLGDVINSRGIKNRKHFEKKFQAALEEVVRRHKDAFTFPLKQWKGIDEIAGLLKTPGDIYKIITTVNELLDPEQMRFVMAVGQIDVSGKSKDISLLDGPVFHEAATKMGEIKKDKWLFGVAGVDGLEAKALDVQVNSLLLIRAGWTEKQRKIYYLYSKNENQEQTGKQLKITQQSISKTLRLIAGTQVFNLESKLTDWANAVFANR
jgi:hypothetical protein